MLPVTFQRYKETFRINREKYKQEYENFIANLSDVEKEQLERDAAAKRKKLLAIKTKRVSFTCTVTLLLMDSESFI